MTIKVIVEFPAKPGKRAEFKSLLEKVAAKYGPSQPSSLGSTRYGVLDNPNILVEIAGWAPAAVWATATAGGDGLYQILYRRISVCKGDITMVGCVLDN